MKGKLLVIGGAESKGNEENNDYDFSHNGVLERFISELKHKKRSRIEIITSASTMPREIGNEYVKAFRKLGAENTGVMIIENRDEADLEKNLKRLQDANAVFFTGGTQLRLTSILGGTEFYKLLVEKLEKDKGFVYAGTSAGAAVASESMICGGDSKDAAFKGEIITSTGFGLVRDIIFDTHFIRRGRIGRLFEIIVTNPKILGVGLEENTALLIRKDRMEAVGEGMAILVDGRHITNSNLLDIDKGKPLSIENMTLHVMSQTDVYHLEAHKLEIKTPKEEQVS
jgi:cyanophycinase